jgi:hypothetical protein
MTNRTRAGIVLSMVSLGLVGCGDHDTPTAPSAPQSPSVEQPSPQPQPNPQPASIQPTITALAPHVGSTRGGAWATITGADFQSGATVRLGDNRVWAWVYDSATIGISTTAHAAETVDVVVTNPGGLEARLPGGYSYASPDSFDFNGDWIAHVGEYETDVRFTIRNNVLVSVSCDMSAPLTFAPPPSVRNGEFSFVSDDGLAITGRLVSPVGAVGTINVPACPAGEWWADKSGVAAASRYPYTGR